MDIKTAKREVESRYDPLTLSIHYFDNTTGELLFLLGKKRAFHAPGLEEAVSSGLEDRSLRVPLSLVFGYLTGPITDPKIVRTALFLCDSFLDIWLLERANDSTKPLEGSR